MLEKNLIVSSLIYVNTFTNIKRFCGSVQLLAKKKMPSLNMQSARIHIFAYPLRD